MTTESKKYNSKWLFVAPISGVKIDAHIDKEIRIRNVVFITSDKLPKVRKRLGFPLRLSDYASLLINSKLGSKNEVKFFLNYSQVFGICNFSGIPNETHGKNISVVEEALHLLSFSTLFFNSRNFNSKIEIKRSKDQAIFRVMLVDKLNKRFNLNFKSLHPVPLVLNEEWESFNKSHYFLKFLKILNGEINIKTKWKNLLSSAAIISGESLNSHNLPDAFLKNVIVLEMLLVNQSEKIKLKLVERIAYFMDWSENWESDNVEKKIGVIYDKRCAYVHDGKSNDITKEDLLFTDGLIFNIFNNIINSIDRIDSKGALIDFSDKYLAEKKLGLKSKYQLGNFKYIKQSNTENKINLFDFI